MYGLFLLKNEWYNFILGRYVLPTLKVKYREKAFTKRSIQMIFKVKYHIIHISISLTPSLFALLGVERAIIYTLHK